MTARQGLLDDKGSLQSVFKRGEHVSQTKTEVIVDVPDGWPCDCFWNVESQAFEPRPMTGEFPDL